MKDFYIFIVFVINAFIVWYWVGAEDIASAFFASAIASTVLFPITAIEVLIVEHFFSFITKEKELA